MRKLFLFLIGVVLFTSCKKEDKIEIITEQFGDNAEVKLWIPILVLLNQM